MVVLGLVSYFAGLVSPSCDLIVLELSEEEKALYDPNFIRFFFSYYPPVA